MKTATCLQHVPFEGPGAFRPALEKRGYRVETRLVPEQGLPHDFSDFLLVMGGPMSVNDAESWITSEQQYVQVAMNKGIPVLGICFGAQLLATVLGGSILPGLMFEIGMVPVTFTEAGKRDPVFSQLPGEFQVFQWHGEEIILPPGIESLMASDNFPVQAFRLPARGYGLLFHLEIEESGIEALCRECPEDVMRGNIPSETVQTHAKPHLPILHQLADQLIEHLTQ